MFHVKHTTVTEFLNHCPLCDSSESGLFLETEDFFLTREQFAIYQCSRCGFRFTNPRPDSESVKTYYQAKDYLSHNSNRKALIPLAYRFVQQYSIRYKFNIVRKVSSGTRILDVGSGTGEFLHYCRRKEWSCFGVEPAEIVRETSIRNYSLNIESTLFSDRFSTGTFDCITFWHVLEHIHDLDKTIRKVKSLLKKEGALLIALPNSSSFDARHYKKYWAAYDLPRHLYHFTEQTVQVLSNKYGFHCVGSVPLKLDAFYISILSEKYMKTVFWPISALVSGIRSNLWARKPGYGHSSTIFILKNQD
jgi:2-polyprenyl-3-methyl-5-hydroxy-6-metoxy-1,4-benzoquinol methylase